MTYKKTRSLEFIDRSKFPGFKEYFERRRLHFKELFKMTYSEENVKMAYDVVTERKQTLY